MTDMNPTSACACLGSVNAQAIETTYEKLAAQIGRASAGQRLRLDLRFVRHGGAAFVGMLVQLKKLALQLRVEVLFTEIQPQVQAVLAICGLTVVLPSELAAGVDQSQLHNKEMINEPTHSCGICRSVCCRYRLQQTDIDNA